MWGFPEALPPCPDDNVIAGRLLHTRVLADYPKGRRARGTVKMMRKRCLRVHQPLRELLRRRLV